MPKHIDVDELKEWVENWFEKNRYYHPYSKSNDIPIPELYDILEQMPPADVVKVVRCKYCKYWKTETEPIGIECEQGETAHYCELTSMITRSNDFCNYGDSTETGERTNG